MAERQVPPPTVNVDLRAEVSHRHRRTLDMPARPPVAEARRRPRRLARRRPPPQRKVQLVVLGVRPDRAKQALIAQLADHRPPAPMRESPIPPVTTRVEVQSVRLIRKAARAQSSGGGE